MDNQNTVGAFGGYQAVKVLILVLMDNQNTRIRENEHFAYKSS